MKNIIIWLAITCGLIGIYAAYSKPYQHSLETIAEYTIPPVLFRIAHEGYEQPATKLPLTLKGMIRLSPFPSWVIFFTYEEFLAHRSEINYPFQWFAARCYALCQERGILPAWGGMYDLLDGFSWYNNDSSCIYTCSAVYNMQRS